MFDEGDFMEDYTSCQDLIYTSSSLINVFDWLMGSKKLESKKLESKKLKKLKF